MPLTSALFIARLCRETDRALPVDVAATLLAHGHNPSKFS